ncbi:MAG: PEP-CTERM sorting domain-containing protein [Gammaproteobacteria bacterium]|nr:PEP-CTERM sorting domain-containing protein [Gammaproteobacteria bacterium]
MNNTRKFLIALALSAVAGIANAVPITGSIGFNGAYTHDGSSLLDATTITITTAEVAGIVTGSFAAEGIVAGDATTYSNFIFDPISTPINNIWTVGSFSFTLNDMSVDFQSATLLALSGTGMFSSTDAGLDDSFGQWTFTANQNGANLTWSSSAAPEPAMVLLLATGLIGFGFARKMRKA